MFCKLLQPYAVLFNLNGLSLFLLKKTGFIAYKISENI